jgi:hypothetical protein
MSGKPTARQGDAAHGLIVQGPATALIGSQGNAACAVCPGGTAVGGPDAPWAKNPGWATHPARLGRQPRHAPRRQRPHNPPLALRPPRGFPGCCPINDAEEILPILRDENCADIFDELPWEQSMAALTQLTVIATFFLLHVPLCFANNDEAQSISNIFIAADIAYKDYSKGLYKMPHFNDATATFYSKIENFKITIEDNEDCYTITFSPKQTKKFKILGHGASYKINKRDYIILEKVFSQ